MALGFVLVAFVLFVFGSIAIAHGCAVITRKLGFSPLVVGLVVIAVVASLPVLFVLLRAKAAGAPDLAIGGIVGGVIFALTFLLGGCALVHPLECPPKVMGRDIGALLLASLCFLFLAVSGVSSRPAGLVLLSVFAGYITVTFLTDRRRATEHSIVSAHAQAMEIGNLGLSGGFFLTALGMIVVMLGAHLTVVAASIMVPAFLVVFAGASRGRSNVLVGYAVMLGIFDLTCVLGLCLLFFPVKISNVFVIDSVVLACVCVFLPVMAAMHWRLSQPRGVVLMLGYGLYLFVLSLIAN